MTSEERWRGFFDAAADLRIPAYSACDHFYSLRDVGTHGISNPPYPQDEFGWTYGPAALKPRDWPVNLEIELDIIAEGGAADAEIAFAMRCGSRYIVDLYRFLPWVGEHQDNPYVTQDARDGATAAANAVALLTDQLGLGQLCCASVLRRRNAAV